jgi:hypothetical protein
MPAAPILMGLILITFTISTVSVKVSPDGPPAERTWNQTGNTYSIEQLPFDYVERVPSIGVTLTTVKTAPGCSPEQVRRGMLFILAT